VKRALHDVTLDIPFGQRPFAMGARILNSVEIAIDIEQRDWLVTLIDAQRLAGAELIDAANSREGHFAAQRKKLML
jgi:hypothetical protein